MITEVSAALNCPLVPFNDCPRVMVRWRALQRVV